jgi:hypothetical protein
LAGHEGQVRLSAVRGELTPVLSVPRQPRRKLDLRRSSRLPARRLAPQRATEPNPAMQGSSPVSGRGGYDKSSPRLSPARSLTPCRPALRFSQSQHGMRACRSHRTTRSGASSRPSRGLPRTYRSADIACRRLAELSRSGNEAPPAGLASKVPDGSDPSTLAWPSRWPAALRRRRRHPAAQRSWSRSFASGDTFLTGTPIHRGSARSAVRPGCRRSRAGSWPLTPTDRACQIRASVGTSRGVTIMQTWVPHH